VTCGLAAAAAAVVFAGFFPIPWPGHPPRLGLMVASDQYVLCGLAVLAGIALVLARERVRTGHPPAVPRRSDTRC
jgi:hypothetical protein